MNRLALFAPLAWLLALSGCTTCYCLDSGVRVSAGEDSSAALDTSSPDSGALWVQVHRVSGERFVRAGQSFAFDVRLGEDVMGAELLVSSSHDGVVPNATITVSGTGSERTVELPTLAVGRTTLHFTAYQGAEASEVHSIEVEVFPNRSAWTGYRQITGELSAAVTDLAVGAQGELYTLGWDRPERFRAVARRYSTAGEVEWSSILEPPLDAQGGSIALLPSGELLFSAQAKVQEDSNYQYLYVGTVAANGGVPMERHRFDAFNGAGGNHTVPGRLSVNEEGAYATGFWAQDGTEERCGVMQMNPEGVPVFSTTLTQGEGGCRMSGVQMVDNTVVFGLSASLDALGDSWSGGWDSWVGRLDADGELLWRDHLGGAGDQWVGELIAGSSGDVLLCGSSDDLHSANTYSRGSRDAMLRSYTPDGTVRWTTRWGTDGIDACSGVSIDHEGNIYTVGVEQHDVSANTSELVVRSFGPDGDQRWSTLVPTDQAATTLPRSIVVSGFDILLGGHTQGSLPGLTNEGAREGWLVRLDLDGVVQ